MIHDSSDSDEELYYHSSELENIMSDSNYIVRLEHMLEEVPASGLFADGSRTPFLMIATKAGKEDIVTLLLDKGANVDRVDKYGNTSLMVAAQKCHEGIFNLLIARGADILKHNNCGETALSYASEDCDNPVKYRMCKTLIEKNANVDTVNELGYGPLHKIAGSPFTDLLELIVSKTKCIDYSTNPCNETPLHAAVEEENLTYVKILIEKGAKINCLNSHDQTPFYMAIEMNSVGVLEYLLSHGANIDEVIIEGEEKHITPPLVYADYNGSVEVIIFLLNHGADIYKKHEERLIRDVLLDNANIEPEISNWIAATENKSITFQQLCFMECLIQGSDFSLIPKYIIEECITWLSRTILRVDIVLTAKEILQLRFKDDAVASPSRSAKRQRV